MKKLWALFVAAVFLLSLATLAIAAEEKKAAPAPAKSEPAKKDAEPAKKEAAKKPRPKYITGTIESLDVKAGTFSVKGKKDTVQLKAGEKVKLEGFKVGDKVTAAYADGVASKVFAPKKAAPKKEEPKKDEPKKEEKKPEPTKKDASPAAPKK